MAAATFGLDAVLRSSPWPSRVRKASTSEPSAVTLDVIADFVTPSVTTYPRATAVPPTRARLAASTIVKRGGVRRRKSRDGTCTLGVDLVSEAGRSLSTTVGPGAPGVDSPFG